MRKLQANREKYIMKGLVIINILTMNMPRKMKENKIVECNEKNKNRYGFR